MLTMKEECLLEAYREALNNIKVDFIHVAGDRNIDLYNGKTDISLFFLKLRETHRELRFAGSFEEFSNWREEVDRYRDALKRFEESGCV